MASARQVAANRRNAQKACGPVTLAQPSPEPPPQAAWVSGSGIGFVSSHRDHCATAATAAPRSACCQTSGPSNGNESAPCTAPSLGAGRSSV